MKMKKKGYGWLMALTVIISVAMVATIIPYSGASKASLLGYHALCSFSPISTILCLLIAVALCVVRRRKFKVTE